MTSSRRRKSLIAAYDIIHIILAVIIVIMVVFAFISPLKYMMFFPIIFLLFAVNCLMDAVKYFKNEEHWRYSFAKGAVLLAIALFMLFMSTVGFLNI